MKKFGILFLGFLLILGGLYMLGYSAFGTKPGPEYKNLFKASPQYSSDKNIFVNRRENILKIVRDRSFNLSTFKDFFSKGKDRYPNRPLPEIRPDLNEFIKKADEIKVIWLGHSTFLLNLSGNIILVDPVFSGTASPFSFMIKRFQKPALSLSELPEIDYILISHDHYDHLDMQSIEFFKNKKTKFITPLGVGSYLIGWGIDKTRITERDWWQSAQFENIEFIATPAQHFSGRDFLHENVTLWASWVIKTQSHNIYFSGDSGYDTHFKAIGDKYGPFDIAFIENGQYNEKWREVHLLPEESVQAYFDLRAKAYFPIHWGMFQLSLHTWYEPIVKIHQAAKEKGINLITPKLGEAITISEKYVPQSWWEEFI